MTIINDEIAKRAIYIDFEGNVGRAPTFLGAQYLDEATGKTVFGQYVHEDVFQSAGDVTDKCINKSIESSIKSLARIAYRENRLFFAWSTREKIAIESFLSNEKLKEFVLSRLFDCKTIAKRWKGKFHRQVRFRRLRGQGVHRLSEYMSLVGYEVPPSAGPGNTGKRLRDVREQLSKRDGNYLNLTPVAKRKWKNVLTHNYHDCRGMRAVTKAAISGLKTFRFQNRLG
ncbi:hypothetical protein M1N56_06395 [Dehalococcoidia bacterium]|nr:hypothetical protein [Dehalococcoidia bacterium]